MKSQFRNILFASGMILLVSMMALGQGEECACSMAPNSSLTSGALPTKVRVSGTVYVANKYFYENPESVTVSRLREMRQRGQTLPVRSEYRDMGDINHPLSNVEVTVEKLTANGEKEVFAKTITGSEGKYSVLLDKGSDYIISVKTENFATSEPLSIPENEADTLKGPDLQIIVKPLGEFSRAIIGVEQSGTTSAKGLQKIFMDLTVSAPLPFAKNIDPFFGVRGRAWGTVRVTTVPLPSSTTIGTLISEFGTVVSNLKVSEVAQAVEFLAGGEYRLFSRKKPRPAFPFGSFDNSTANRFTLSLIAGGGAITPINPKDTLEIFKVSPDAPGLPPQAIGKDFIAFVSPDRDRFFRQYYAGLRAQTYYFNAQNDDIPLNRFPATLDLTFGQNESVTGGRLRGGVLRLEGFFPLPYEGMKFINLFGTAIIRLSRTQITDPLLLEPAPAGTTVPAANAIVLTIPQVNRDYYKIGVGIDFMSAVKKLGIGKK